MIIPVPRFLCDEMLKGFARWLRAAGYDTELAAAAEQDRQLIAKALDSQRLLLTRDSKMMEIRGAKDCVLLLSCNSIDSCALELARRCQLSWNHRRFSRCLLCNTPIKPATAEQWRQVPAESIDLGTEAFYCEHCQKVYWEGSHVRRMRSRLDNWQRLLETRDG